MWDKMLVNGNTVNRTPANDETQCLHWIDLDMEKRNDNPFENETQSLHWLDLDKYGKMQRRSL